MNKNQAVPFEVILTELEKREEFNKADRQLRPYYDLIKAIVGRRTELGLTQEELARKANTFQSRISKIESAEHDIRLSTLIEIAEALDTEVSIQLQPIYRPVDYYDIQKDHNIIQNIMEFQEPVFETTPSEYPVNTGFEKKNVEITVPV